jgi:hypothetical protein
MPLSDVLAGASYPLLAQRIDASLPSDAQSLPDLLRQPSLAAVELFGNGGRRPPSLAEFWQPGVSEADLLPYLIAPAVGSSGDSSPNSLAGTSNPLVPQTQGDGWAGHAGLASESLPTALSPIWSAGSASGARSPFGLLTSADDEVPVARVSDDADGGDAGGANTRSSTASDTRTPSLGQPPRGDVPARTPLTGFPIEVDPNDPDAVQRAYDILSGNFHPSKVESAVRGGLQGASLNLVDRLAGAANASGIPPSIPGSELLGTLRLGAEAIAPSIFGESATDRYNQTASLRRALDALAARENPNTYNTADLMGHLAAERALGGAPGLIKAGAQLGRDLFAGAGSAERGGGVSIEALNAALTAAGAPSLVAIGGSASGVGNVDRGPGLLTLPDASDDSSTLAQLPKGGAYLLLNPDTGEVMRTGRSKDLDRRQGEHSRDPILKRFDFSPAFRTDNYAEQRGLEQHVHDLHKPLFNYINPIDPRNARRQNYIDAARRYLEQ